MKQLIQYLDSGETLVLDVPKPSISDNEVLIQSACSVISAGTERTMLEFGQSNWLKRATKHPEKVEQVLAKLKTDGLASTLESVRAKLDQPLTLGYSNAGVVVAKGKNVTEVALGDRVLSNGSHAEVVAVGKNLCARIPQNVSYKEASFGVIASIALQSVRLAESDLGETFVVMGLGLVGLFVVQLLRASGCKVICTDFNSQRLDLARSFGATTIDLKSSDNLVDHVTAMTDGYGCDGVIIATATDSNDPVRDAAQMSRKKGRIILVGVAGLELRREDLYEKELSLVVSCSYGPGRYDTSYELKGIDYPYHYVRWTEQRNFEAVLNLMSEGKLISKDLISHQFEIVDASEAYELLSGSAESLGILINYSNIRDKAERKISLKPDDEFFGQTDLPQVSVLGAGNYSRSVLIPALAQTSVQLDTLVSERGLNAAQLGRKFDFAFASSDPFEVIKDKSSDTIVLATQHNDHAAQVISALESGKHVFCEKPLCLTLDQLDEIKKVASRKNSQLLMVGFNRRYAPLIKMLKKSIANSSTPKLFNLTINAGAVENHHWIQDPQIGGGRIIGEACHFIDLIRYLVGFPAVKWQINTVGRMPSSPSIIDNFTITLSFEDGSLGSINYFSMGNKKFSKERIECFTDGRVFQIDNFRSLRVWKSGSKSVIRKLRQDKGQKKCISSFISALNGDAKAYLIPKEEIFETAQIAIDLSAQAK